MTPAFEAHYVGGVVLGEYAIPRRGEVELADPRLRKVVNSVALVAKRTCMWPVDIGDIADTLLVVYEDPDPIRLLADLILEWDRVEDRARELVPLVLLSRAFDAAMEEELAATEALDSAIETRAAARGRVDAIARRFPRRTA